MEVQLHLMGTWAQHYLSKRRTINSMRIQNNLGIPSPVHTSDKEFVPWKYTIDHVMSPFIVKRCTACSGDIVLSEWWFLRNFSLIASPPPAPAILSPSPSLLVQIANIFLENVKSRDINISSPSRTLAFPFSIFGCFNTASYHGCITQFKNTF